MKQFRIIIALFVGISLISSCKESFDPTDYVVTSMGTSGDGGIVPVASYPFGMVQLAADTFNGGTGYRYEHTTIHGFSHTHKSGSGGGSDYLDILFLPLNWNEYEGVTTIPSIIDVPFSHENEISKPGYYSVKLEYSSISAELTATERCGMHKYTYPADKGAGMLIDLKWGNPNNCTIIAEDQYDTVLFSSIEKVSDYVVRGCRITNGWCPEMHVYFYARFSRPIKDFRVFDHCNLVEGASSLEGQDIRALLSFGGDETKPVEVSVGISAVDEEGARKNLEKEIGTKPFAKVAASTHKAWVKQLSTLEVNDPSSDKGKTLYTCYYFSLMYPMLYSDVDGRFRSSDKLVHSGDFKYYAGVIGLWDIFRSHLPLIAVLRPDISTDLMKTFLEHYDNCGQLPIWTLSGQETNCMEGYHSAPVIADFYSKGIRGFDAEKMLEALQVSACRDTFGYFCRNYRGAKNYIKYNYVPYDLEVSAVSKTLEYCYDDWCISKFAGMLGRNDVEKEYFDRSQWYRNLFDKGTNLMRPKDSKGNFIDPFDPFYSNHNRADETFMEGSAWHWTFHVMQDPEGLMELMGGPEAMASKLDSMFFVLGNEIHGPNPSGDMTGMIGHYSQGNEPGHHTIYLYNVVGKPWRTQQLITKVIDELYSTDPDGICGNDDTGQMSAWYFWSSLGIYPMTHGDGRYMIGSPQHEKMVFHHANGTLTVEAPGVSRENCYIKSITLNGKPFTGYSIDHKDIFNGNATLHFEMCSSSNGVDLKDTPADNREAVISETEGDAPEKREEIEWSMFWTAHAPDTSLPRVLLIGDSITNQYHFGVDEALDGKAAVSRLATSAPLGSPILLKEIEKIMAGYSFDVIHINNGLHGWRYSEAEYAAALPEMYALIRKNAPNAKLIWATCTAIHKGEGMKELEERVPRIRERNRIAIDFFKGKPVIIDDLFNTVSLDSENYEGGDGCHLNARGTKAAVDQVSSIILSVL